MRLARRIVDKGLSVRQVEEEVRRRGEPAKAAHKQEKATLPSDVIDQVRDSFYGLLGVVPRVRERGAGGVIELPFKDPEELGRLLDRLP